MRGTTVLGKIYRCWHEVSRSPVRGNLKMMHAGYLVGCLILLLSHSPVSGLCSTCLDDACYDNGECITGCVPGYVGEYCDKKCPSRCLNKRCHLHINSGAVTCTDGCERGYCDIKCEVECPGDCATCDRQCGSCNITHCPERRYGADCSKVCNTRYSRCDRETGECIICRRGYFGDECDQKCTACFTRAANILDSCLSGCDICQTKEPCPAGFHGDLCERPCFHGCDSPERGCNRATGECSDGCVSGYHGLTCNYTCNEHCLSGRCKRATGECSNGCVSGYYGLTCNYTCNSFCEGGICNQQDRVCTSGCISGYKSHLDMCEKYTNEGSHTTVAVAVPITIVCLFAGLVTAAVIWRIRRSRRPNRPRKEQAEKATDNVQQIPYRSIQAIPTKNPESAQLLSDESVPAELHRDKSLPWTDGMIARSAADLVLCRLKLGDNWTVVIGRAMILNSERVHEDLQVEDFGRVLTNLERSRHRKSPGQFSGFYGTCSSPIPVPPSPSPLTTPPSYWETNFTLTQRERGWLLLLEMGLIQGRCNMDERLFVSDLPNSACVSVWDVCHNHPDHLCIQVWRRDQEDSKEHQVGECVSLSLPTPGVEFTLTFGLVLDVGRGRVGFIDVERGQLLCKVDLQMKEEVSPMFYVDPYNNDCATRMRLISGREICVTDRKIHLIQQALSD